MDKLRADGHEGLRSEGIFRIPGDAEEMKSMRAQLNQGADPRALISRCPNLHSVAGLLKMYFRELRTPLLGFALYDDLVRCSAAIGAPSPSADVEGLCVLLQQLPPGHYQLLRHLIGFLAEVVTHSGASKMTVGNTAAVFAPNLLRAEVETIERLADTGHVVNLVAVLISCHARIFDGASSATQPALAGQRSSEAHIPQLASRDSVEAPPALLGGSAQGSAYGSGDALAPRLPAREWYYLNLEHEQQGPVEWETLRALFQQSHISSSTFVFADGLEDWKPVADLSASDLNGADPLL